MNSPFEKFALDADGKVDLNGFWTTKARFARPGVQVYGREEFADWPDSDKISRYYAKVLRPENVVFDTKAMKSFENVPISVEHSGEMLNPDNVTRQIVGSAGAPVTREGDTLVVPVTLYARDAIEQAKAGSRKELSAGYFLDVEYAPGNDEKYGEYDYIMKSWKGNHITLTKAGKAGHEFYVGDKKMPDKEETVEIVHRVFDGVRYAFGDQSAAVFDKVLAERDAARAELKTAKDKILTEDQINAEVEKRVKVAMDAKEMVEITEKVKAAYPSVALDGKSSDYIRALFDMIKEKPVEGKVNDRALDRTVEEPADEGVLGKARSEFINKNSGRR